MTIMTESHATRSQGQVECFWGSTQDLPLETGNSSSESSFGSQGLLADCKGLKSSLPGQCWARHGLHEVPTFSSLQSNGGWGVLAG